VGGHPALEQAIIELLEVPARVICFAVACFDGVGAASTPNGWSCASTSALTA
jgi:hypothetical protein